MVSNTEKELKFALIELVANTLTCIPVPVNDSKSFSTINVS